MMRPPVVMRRSGVWLLKGAVGFVVLSLAWVLLYTLVPPPFTATMLLNGDGITKDWRSLDAIDPDMARAAIASEDARFCAHDGFDRAAIEDAWQRYRRGGRIRGGSTISQQTAKNAFLWQGGGFFRKGLEAWFTVLIETLWSKRRIMEVYINIAETGIGTYGVEAGSQRYFEHGADRLTATEAARIAAVLPLPKKRGAVAPTGFTRRYGNSIRARMEVVQRDGLADCLELASSSSNPVDEPPRQRPRRPMRDPAAALDALVPREVPVPEVVDEDPVIDEPETIPEEPEPALEEPADEPEEPLR